MSIGVCDTPVPANVGWVLCTHLPLHIRLRSVKLPGCRYRLVAAIHFNRQLIFTLMVLTHAEYGRGDWKERL